nr:transposase [Vibrio sp. 1180_3]
MEWEQPKLNKSGTPQLSNDLAITTARMARRLFSLALTALQGIIDSIFRLANVLLACPHYTCISQRAKDVKSGINSIELLICHRVRLSGVTDTEELPNLLKQANRALGISKAQYVVQEEYDLASVRL